MSPGLYETVYFFRIVHAGELCFCLTVDARHELRVDIDDLMTLENGLSKAAQDTGFDGAKPQAVNQRHRCLANDRILQ
jgi:hypothetical protein